VLACPFGSCASELFFSYGGGHYYAYCRPNDGDDWVEFNDSAVRDDVEPVITKAAYILFFRRVNDCPRTLENLRAADARCREDGEWMKDALSASPESRGACVVDPKLLNIRCHDVAGMSARNAVPYETMPQVKLDEAGGAAVAKAAPKKAPVKAKAKEESPVAAREKPARARKPVTYKVGDSDDDTEDDDDSFAKLGQTYKEETSDDDFEMPSGRFK